MSSLSGASSVDQENTSYFVEWLADETEFPPLPNTSDLSTTNDATKINESSSESGLSFPSSMDSSPLLNVTLDDIYNDMSNWDLLRTDGEAKEEDSNWSLFSGYDMQSYSTRDTLDQLMSMCSLSRSILMRVRKCRCCWCCPCYYCDPSQWVDDEFDPEYIYDMCKARGDDPRRQSHERRLRDLRTFERICRDKKSSIVWPFDTKTQVVRRIAAIRYTTRSTRKVSQYRRQSKLDHREYSVLYNSKKQYQRNYEYQI